MLKETLKKYKNVDLKSKVLVQNIAMSFGVKGLAIVISLINMPIFMGYFEESAVLGVWFTLLSMLNWVLTFDFGIGNGLRNYLVIALEHRDDNECRRLIASSYCSISILVIFLSFIAYYVIPKADWNEICNISTDIISADILVLTLRILSVGVLIQFLLKLITSILHAMQKPAISNFLLLISNTLLLFSTFILNTGNPEKNLVRLSIAYILTANLPMLAATLYVFFKPLRHIGIHPTYWSKIQTKQIITLGMSFFTLQILSLISFNTREFFIMRFYSPEAVVPHQVYHKLFSLVSTFFVLAMTPMWSAITQAVAQNDMDWVKKMYRNTTKLFFIFCVGSVLVLLMSQFLVNIWLGDKRIEINYTYGLIFAVLNIEYMWINFHSHFENGMKKLHAQKLGYIIATVLLPIFTFLFSRSNPNWICVVISNVLVVIPICILQFIHMKKLN